MQCLFGQVGGVTYALYSAGIAPTAGPIAGFVIGQCILLIFGVVSLRRTTLKLFNLEVNLLDYGWGVCGSVLDVLTFGAAAISCMFVVRLYHIFSINSREGEATVGYRSYVWRQLGMTVIDLLVLPAVLIVFIGHWRWDTARKEVAALSGKEGEQRVTVLVHTLKVLLDLIPFALGSLCFVTHRCFTLYNELKAAEHIDNWRGIFLWQFFSLLFGTCWLLWLLCGCQLFGCLQVVCSRSLGCIGYTDIPFAILALFLLPAFWRLISIGMNWNHANATAASRRRLVVAEFLLALIDIPTLLAGGLVLVTYYRFDRLKRKVAETPGFFAPFNANDGFCSHTLDAHGRVWGQFLSLWIDMPCALVAVVVILTGWRTKEFFRDWNTAPENRIVMARRELCWYHFGNLLIDIPFILFSVGVTCIVYRAWTLWSRMYDCQRANDRRWVCIVQFVEFIIDLPFIAIGAVVMCCVWRMPFFVRDCLKDYNQLVAADRRRAATQNLALAVLDVIAFPMFVVTALSAYRMGGLMDQLRASHGLWHPLVIDRAAQPSEYSDRFGAHGIIIFEFLQLLADIPFIACGVVCVCSIYRALPLRRALIETNGAGNRRMACLAQFGSLLLDLPFLVLLAFVLPLGLTTLGVRSYLVLRDTYRLDDASARRRCVSLHALLVVLDILAIPCALFLTYRWPDARRKLVCCHSVPRADR